jgi:hypothetical protein
MHYDPRIGKVTEEPQAFWQHQLGPITAAFYTRHVYPKRYHAELEKIARYAKANSIELAFVIFPTHVELQNRVRDFGLEGEYIRFKREVSALAPTYDYDYSNEMTSDKDNFLDPYHCRQECVDRIIREVWSGHFIYGRPLTAKQP